MPFCAILGFGSLPHFKPFSVRERADQDAVYQGCMGLERSLGPAGPQKHCCHDHDFTVREGSACIQDSSNDSRTVFRRMIQPAFITKAIVGWNNCRLFIESAQG
jgi:hypothetical protein